MATVDHDINVPAQPVANFFGVRQRERIARQQERGAHERLAKRTYEQLSDFVVRDANADRALLRVLQALRQFVGSFEDECVRTWRQRLEQPIGGILDTRINRNIGEIPTGEREVVVTFDAAQSTNTLERTLVAQMPAERVARVRRISDDTALSKDLRSAVQQAQLQLDQAKTQLQFLMGRASRDPNFEVESDLRRDPVKDSQPDIVRKAVALRPDYLTGIQSQATSQADLRLQVANGRVDYVLGSEYTHQSAGGYNGSSMGFSISMPIRIFNKNQGEIARAERELALAGARRTALEASINLEVERAYRQYRVSRQLLADVETNMLAKARTVRDTTEYSYRRGEATLVEFLDAQRAFNDAMQTFNDARAGYARSLYLIDTVSGETVSGN